MASSAIIKEAAQAWKYLNGIVCLYKPVGMATRGMNEVLRLKLCEDLNSMKCREPEAFVRIERVEAGKTAPAAQVRLEAPLPPQLLRNADNVMNVDFTPKVLHSIPDTAKTEVQVIKTINYADHPLVVGPRYQPSDFKLQNVNWLGRETSGVALIGLNDGIQVAHRMFEKKWLRAFILTAEFGRVTEDGFYTSKVIEKTTYHKITTRMLQKVLMSMQAAHQRAMYQSIKAPLTSQLAFDLASRGLVRPDDRTEPVIYGLKLLKFEPPHFEIEIHVINETETFLMTIPHLVALKLHSGAVCTKVRCIKYGPFTVDHTALMKHWTVKDLLTNMNETREIVREHNLRLRQPLVGAGGSEVQEDENENDNMEVESSSESRTN